MTRDASGEPTHPADPLQVEQLTESHRFDEEPAQLLTQFQYREDGITLTAAEPRPLPTHNVEPTTAGLETVFEAGSSLVFVCYDDREHTMVNPIETRLIDVLAAAIQNEPPARLDGGASGTLGEGPATGPAAAGTTPEIAEPDTPTESLSTGVATPHDAQRRALDAVRPESVTANTVENIKMASMISSPSQRQCQIHSSPGKRTNSSSTRGGYSSLFPARSY